MFALCMLQVSIQKKGSGQGACGWLAETLPAPFSVRKNFGVATQTFHNVLENWQISQPSYLYKFFAHLHLTCKCICSVFLKF